MKYNSTLVFNCIVFWKIFLQFILISFYHLFKYILEDMTTGHVKDWHAIYIFWRQPLVPLESTALPPITLLQPSTSTHHPHWAETLIFSVLLHAHTFCQECKTILQLKNGSSKRSKMEWDLLHASTYCFCMHFLVVTPFHPVFASND